MITAVQLRKHPNVTAQLVAGTPVRQINEVALFAPSQLVAYMIEGVQHTLILVFRTLAALDPSAAKLPGVHPRVSLLLEARGTLSASRLRNLFRYLSRRGLRPEDLLRGLLGSLGRGLERPEPPGRRSTPSGFAAP